MHSEKISVSNLMNPKVQTDFEDQNIMSACNIMYANNIGSVIIVSHDRNRGPLGIITERDVVRILGKLDPNLLQTPLSTLMSKPIITIKESASINEATKIMNNKKIRRLVVIDKNNKMIGILTQRDIFKAIDKDPDLFSEFYGNAFSSKFKEIYERYNKYSLED
ncbi:MAG TPA: CBS domain-containing protein [Nitrososphaeraceae archaeon]|nr:CBS domain-containing protein [Nitrososphaeraceae archaeon]